MGNLKRAERKHREITGLDIFELSINMITIAVVAQIEQQVVLTYVNGTLYEHF
jgi:hypothetical protein